MGAQRSGKACCILAESSHVLATSFGSTSVGTVVKWWPDCMLQCLHPRHHSFVVLFEARDVAAVTYSVQLLPEHKPD